MGLIELLIAILVLLVVFYILDKYVAPALPAPWGRVVIAIIAVIIILWLLSRFLGINLG